MVLVPAQSLFEPQGSSAIADAAAWISGTLLGSLATGLCVIAVAAIGLMTLSGHLHVRRGMHVVLGCFVLLGAPTIAAAFSALWSEAAPPVPPPMIETTPEPARADLPPANYDPYAGASLRQD
ncbi:MAG: hypothetical protein C0510_00415 [Erythrobacter sp.]|nr:hypothetical protein [Erythrobacter sp.]